MGVATKMQSSPNRASQLGELMQRWRERNSMSQREIALRMGYRNINFISMLEHGGSSIPFGKIFDVIKAYELPPEIGLIMVMETNPEAWKTIVALNERVIKSKAFDSAIQRSEEAYRELLNDVGMKRK